MEVVMVSAPMSTPAARCTHNTCTVCCRLISGELKDRCKPFKAWNNGSRRRWAVLHLVRMTGGMHMILR